jgi:Domain of unknown function (DUF1906)
MKHSSFRSAAVRGRLLASLGGVALLTGIVAPAPAGASTPVRSATGGTYSGLGWDNCGVPTVAQLTAWNGANSPYKALNVYIGGVNAACPAKVSPGWVQSVTKLGFGIIPTYVGLQSPHPECPCAAIEPSKAYAEGVTAADAAVKLMIADGMGKRSPVYDDMEGYTRDKEDTTAVLGFLRGWTVELHKSGFVSGVYAGGDSGITDLVNVYGTTYTEPDDIWIADWNGKHTVSSPYVPSKDWAHHQRLHQFSGNVDLSYGGVTFTGADGDYCDGAVVSS